MNLEETEWNDMDWIDRAWKMDQQHSLVNIATSLWVP
jgi:hypothetical protein